MSDEMDQRAAEIARIAQERDLVLGKYSDMQNAYRAELERRIDVISRRHVITPDYLNAMGINFATDMNMFLKGIEKGDRITKRSVQKEKQDWITHRGPNLEETFLHAFDATADYFMTLQDTDFHTHHMGRVADIMQAVTTVVGQINASRQQQ